MKKSKETQGIILGKYLPMETIEVVCNKKGITSKYAKKTIDTRFYSKFNVIKPKKETDK